MGSTFDECFPMASSPNSRKPAAWWMEAKHSMGQAAQRARGNTNASSGAWQGCSALPITGLTQISSQCGEPEREPRAAFDIVMLYALLSIPWQGTQQPGLAASLLAVLERARAVTAADVFGFPLLVTSKCSTLCSACSSAPVTACLGSPVSCQPCRS